ncbi:hypothetical protein OG723_44245 (plasmid) [Streptomyces sp. NBC_01278]|uniref:hypothetical protein n=1 Tax=Streptomyces sp. NBC_01278 TaxID=2903809 RepID=UPI002E33AE30|nr:hypothetical protein [Streptomyces sp. NBC_01278]
MPAPEYRPSHDEIEEEIEFLAQLSDEDYAREFAALVQDLAPEHRSVPRPVTGLAIRSDELSRRSMKTARLLHRQAADYLVPIEGESRGAHESRLAAFRARMDLEQVLLQIVMDAYPARRGRMPTRANPRRRAAEELARRHPEEFLALLRVEQESDKARKRGPRTGASGVAPAPADSNSK